MDKQIKKQFDIVDRQSTLVVGFVSVLSDRLGFGGEGRDDPDITRLIETVAFIRQRVIDIKGQLEALEAFDDDEAIEENTEDWLREKALKIANSLHAAEHLTHLIWLNREWDRYRHYVDIMFELLVEWHAMLDALKNEVMGRYNLRPATPEEHRQFACPPGTKC